MHKAILILAAIIGLSTALKSQQEAPLELHAVASNTPSFIITDPAEVLQHVGELVTVQGCVVSAKLKERVKNKPIFLDMFAAYPDNLFAVAIWEKDQPKFLSAIEYHQKIVRITGRVHKEEPTQAGKENVRPLISLHEPNQIQILGDCK